MRRGAASSRAHRRDRLAPIIVVFIVSGCVGPTLTSTTASTPLTTSGVITPTTMSIEATTSTPTTTTERGSLGGRVIVIDTGHNGRNAKHSEEISRLVDIGNGTKSCNTTGTATADGYPEPEFTWAMAGLTRKGLESKGAQVVLTRPDKDGWGPCITERAAIGNEAGADAVVSIRAEGGPGDGRGFHVIFPASIPGLTDDIAATSHDLAVILREDFAMTGMPAADYIGNDGMSERSDLGGLNLSDVPAVFLEAGNMRNDEDAALLADPAFQNKAAAAIVGALIRFLEGRPG